MKKVVAIEYEVTARETVLKDKRHDYKNGGYRAVVVVEREVQSSQVARLECGHVRHAHGQDLRGKLRLSCWHCEDALYRAREHVGAA
jgi:hypothetical protein